MEAVAIHGGKAQEERDEAIDAFKAGKKDVLVATDVASKGLDFPDIQARAEGGAGNGARGGGRG